MNTMNVLGGVLRRLRPCTEGLCAARAVGAAADAPPRDGCGGSVARVPGIPPFLAQQSHLYNIRESLNLAQHHLFSIEIAFEWAIGNYFRETVI